jgi:hypothetical protein
MIFWYNRYHGLINRRILLKTFPCFNRHHIPSLWSPPPVFIRTISRHCEEAIVWQPTDEAISQSGLLRFARNDGERISAWCGFRWGMHWLRCGSKKRGIKLMIIYFVAYLKNAVCSIASIIFWIFLIENLKLIIPNILIFEFSFLLWK